MKRLYLFTGRYPYKGPENFLEDEIIYLSRKFDMVYVIPFLKNSNGCRSMPDNCILLHPIISGKINLLIKSLFCVKVFGMLMNDFFCNKVFCNKKKIKVWITAYSAINATINTSCIKKILRQLTASDVCYFYWGKWGNTISINNKSNGHFVSRFHGDWDLWEEKYDGYAPLRKKVSESLDYAMFISKKGEQYFHSRYGTCSTRLFRLGTKDVGVTQKSNDGTIRILSCSTIYPLKRVDLIFKSVAMASLKMKIEWIHIGGGEGFDQLKQLTKTCKNDNLKVQLLGQMSYSDVLKYYQNNKVDVFVNLSVNEGVPVSIMEAISCDIPIVATDVGGTSEIVCNESGILVNSNPSAEEVANAIVELMKNRNNYNPRKFWQENYKADINYGKFADFLYNLTT